MKGFGNIGNMMKQMQQMQTQMQEVQAKLETLEVEGHAGGGMIQATVTGKGRLRRVVIDPSLLTADEKEVLEDLIVAAVNDAKEKADKMAEAEMGKVTGGLKLPGGMGLPF